MNYLPRVGTSSVTGKRLAAVGVGLRMIALILRFRRRTGAARDAPAGVRRGARRGGA